MLTKIRHQVGGHVPSVVKRGLRKLYRYPRFQRFARRPRWGNLRRMRPFSERWGYDRGTAIDRHYIDRFIRDHASAITGRVLEVKEGLYADVLGHGIDQLDILDVNDRNLVATIIGDLGKPGCLPVGVYDCAIITQTLQYVPETDVAMTNLWQSLKPGGLLLLSVPCLARGEISLLDREAWRFLPGGVRSLVERYCDPAPSELEVTAHGNLLVDLASLLGLAADDLRAAELATDDPVYPLVVTCAARKPATA